MKARLLEDLNDLERECEFERAVKRASGIEGGMVFGSEDVLKEWGKHTPFLVLILLLIYWCVCSKADPEMSKRNCTQRTKRTRTRQHTVPSLFGLNDL